MKKRTKIVCTIGPSSESKEALERLFSAGMNLARLNFSHGTHEWHLKRIALLRELSERKGMALGILQDLCGPKLRLGSLPEEGILLFPGTTCLLSSRKSLSAKEPRLQVPIPELMARLKEGHSVYLKDAEIHLRVLERTAEDVRCLVVTGGRIFSRQGICAPQVDLSIASATAKDLRDIRAAGHLVDWVALSFVQKASDLHPVRALLSEIGSRARLIAKIEKAQALDNLDSILEEVDGIMVARGDLGVEISPVRVPFVQKELIARCNKVGKPVITATQMLESMMTNSRPTRAEAGDVANAILDGTDAVMLSGETATGLYAEESVRMMAEIALETEKHFPFRETLTSRTSEVGRTITDALAQGVCEIASDLQLAALICWTEHGETARFLSRLRPRQPILAMTTDLKVQGHLSLSWGVEPIFSNSSDWEDISVLAREQGCEEGDLVAAVSDLAPKIELKAL